MWTRAQNPKAVFHSQKANVMPSSCVLIAWISQTGDKPHASNLEKKSVKGKKKGTHE